MTICADSRHNLKMTSGEIHIRFADIADCDTVLGFIRALASYEKLLEEVVADEQALAKTLFGNHRFAEVLIAEKDESAVGFALFFHNYSTFLAKPGIYLEDLFVLPDARKHGVGRALITEVAKIAVERNCGRLEWSVLDWNEAAIGFYRRLGAISLDGWSTNRMTGDALRALANS